MIDVRYLTAVNHKLWYVFRGICRMQLNSVVGSEFDGVMVVPRSSVIPGYGIQAMICNALFGVVTQQSKESQLNGIAVVDKLQKKPSQHRLELYFFQ